jgi:hypothetical protein
MSFYFRSVPNFQYINPDKTSSISEYVNVKNIFRKNKIREDIFGNLVYFNKYNIVGNERPDQIAEKFYEDSTLDWVILLSNNIIDLRSEWPLDDHSFREFLLNKYESNENIYNIHHYETNEIRTSSGNIVLPAKLKLEKSWTTNGNFIAAITKQISQIFCDSSGVVTVTLNNGITNLKTGNSITISNVNNVLYNGTFRVTSVFIPFSDNVAYSFTYNLGADIERVNLGNTLDGNENATLMLKDGFDCGNSYYFEYYDNEQLIRVSDSKFVNGVTNYDYELNLNNQKREIFVLKPRYLGVILNDAEKYSNYKIGGSQYIDDKLKRGDNLKLYS